MKKGYWFIVVVVLLVAVYCFWWFEWRPANIRSSCGVYAKNNHKGCGDNGDYNSCTTKVYLNCVHEKGLSE